MESLGEAVHMETGKAVQVDGFPRRENALVLESHYMKQSSQRTQCYLSNVVNLVLLIVLSNSMALLLFFFLVGRAGCVMEK